MIAGHVLLTIFAIMTNELLIVRNSGAIQAVFAPLPFLGLIAMTAFELLVALLAGLHLRRPDRGLRGGVGPSGTLTARTFAVSNIENVKYIETPGSPGTSVRRDECCHGTEHPGRDRPERAEERPRVRRLRSRGHRPGRRHRLPGRPPSVQAMARQPEMAGNDPYDDVPRHRVRRGPRAHRVRPQVHLSLAPSG